MLTAAWWIFTVPESRPQQAHPSQPDSTPASPPAFDYQCDAGYIVAAFQQAYGIDLTRERVHWFRFRALFAALPEETLMAKIMSWRTMDLVGIRRLACVPTMPTCRSALPCLLS